MKKNLCLIILLLAMFIPTLVSAGEVVTYSSKETGHIANFEVDKLEFKTIRCTKYFNLHGSGKSGINVDAFIVNGYPRNVDFDITLYLYDKNDNKLDTFKKSMSIMSLSSDKYEQDIYSNDKYSVDDIEYYELELDVITNVSVTKTEKKYYVDNYHINIDVAENNEYDVNTTFRAVFKDHRTDTVVVGIPMRSNFIRSDGGRLNKRAVIHDIVVPDYYTLSTEQGIRTLTIGKSNLENDTKYYELNYQYNAGRDIRNGKDEFAFYLISNMEAKVDGLSFEIHFPKEISYEDIKFLDQDGILLEDVECDKDGNTIKGSISGTIEPGAAYYVYVILPDHYFVNTKSTIGTFTKLSLLLPIGFLIITILFWYVYKKSDTPIESHSFTFNSSFNSLEVGYLYYGKVRDHDIASLLLYMASKGYIRIEKNGRNYKLVKLKDYGDMDRTEKTFMKELFYDNDEISRQDLSSTLIDLDEKMKNKLAEDKRRKRLYIYPFFNYKLFFYILTAIIFIINTINIIIDYQPSVIWSNILFGGIGYILLLLGLRNKNNKIEKILYTLVSFIFIVSPILLTSYKAFLSDSINLIIYFISFICMISIGVIVNMMSNRTRYGRNMYRKISGYHDYLVNCSDEDILKEMNKHNLFFEVLPYTFVLGISDKWMEKFQDKDVEIPEWYVGENDKEKVYHDLKNIYSDIFIALKSNGK